MFNLFGVLLSSGAVAFGIVSLLPVELILQVGSSAGFAMVFALLIAAIIWNVGTWYFGLPASSSHTLIGSIIGVGITNALLRGRDGTSGVDWSKATEIGYALLMSPLFGFALAAILLLVLKFVVRNPALYAEPKGDQPPPWWIRGILILTCTLVSFFHGSNDGQKGMGLIMLILIGTVPTAYALNRAMPASQMEQFQTNSTAASDVIEAKAAGYNVLGNPRPAVTALCGAAQDQRRNLSVVGSAGADIANQVTQYGSIARMPAEAVGNTRNDMYLASEAIRFLMKDKESDLSKDDVAKLNAYKGSLDNATTLHSQLGQDRGRDRARARHHGGLEAHRGHGRREDRQDPSHLRAGRLRRDHRGGHHRGRRRLRPAGVDHPCAVVGHRRHHDGQRFGPAVVDDPQHRHGLGADLAGRHGDLRQPVLDLLAAVLSGLASLGCASPAGRPAGTPAFPVGRRTCVDDRAERERRSHRRRRDQVAILEGALGTDGFDRRQHAGRPPSRRGRTAAATARSERCTPSNT